MRHARDDVPGRGSRDAGVCDAWVRRSPSMSAAVLRSPFTQLARRLPSKRRRQGIEMETAAFGLFCTATPMAVTPGSVSGLFAPPPGRAIR